MWKDKIKEIIYMLENSDVNEIEVRFWFNKIKVTKRPPVLNVDSSTASNGNTLNVDESLISNDENLVKEEKKIETPLVPNLVEVKSPMPGTFYSSPDPDSSPFVSVGDTVNPGDTVCIVEAMKIMNEIQAEDSGVIEEILIQNASPVEFDQVLFKLKPVS
jgi:acetyl-CoA carboxylase biotin carboxyl carrier protein|tara:strand:+ start:7369 stop:7848 length:480 start_codon:yes stop_codon:yes gene_type:complete